MSGTEETTNWVVAASISDIDALEEGMALSVELGGTAIALCPFEGEVYAINDVCSHGAALLSEGYLDGCFIECPLHQGLFDVRDGSPQSAPVTAPVASYRVKVEDGKVLVALPS
ncbi:non-heme iron oxygenase ferredoxin subunit [Acuticoccus mangrovi]|uniref:Non-heme iron oxygenase ferredoxin subunit n=1 Tax=Acuticoccus mangrovi TaxID=2796142 RepID=A0A934MFU6_9HYPH|nr:non-heme iron oxygenase ferredoxin subunit [Acuticoccus mangrovi]MBJ3775843.1 non-heme iron oxygenase ferredoxin subunit [Acuticoccus mangrovi]